MSGRAPRSTREHLIFKALCVLDDAIDSCSPTPVKPNVGLRLALALLFVFSDGDRQMFDEFWRTVIADDRAIISGDKGEARTSYARTYLTAICHDVGMPLSVDLMIELRQARGLPTYATKRRRFDQVLASRQEGPDSPPGQVRYRDSQTGPNFCLNARRPSKL